jgi:hypothetical protein
MASQKPAALPPNTAHAGGDSPPGIPQDAAGHNSAENPESLDSQAPENRQTQVPAFAAQGPYTVLFTLFQDGNSIRFLSELLTNLLAVGLIAKILPTMEAHCDYPVLGRNSIFPTNAMEAKNFAKAYMADLKVSSKGDMKGKVLLKTQAKFLTFKKNKKFRPEHHCPTLTKSTAGQDGVDGVRDSLHWFLLQRCAPPRYGYELSQTNCQ